MRKFLQLTCLISMFFVGTLRDNLYAQTDQNANTASGSVETQQQQQGTLVKGVIKDAETGLGISGINIASGNFATAITNNDGTFEIYVPHLDALLTINGQDYQAKVYPIKHRTEGIEIFLYESDYSQFYQQADLSGIENIQYKNTEAVTVSAFERTQ